MSWLSRLASLRFSTSSYPFPAGSQNNDGFERNHDNPLWCGPADARVMRLSAVWACVRLLSETIASLPLNTFERVGVGRKFNSDFWLYDLIHDQPSADTTAQAFWEAYTTAMILRGMGSAEKIRNGSGKVIALEFLHPDRLSGPDRSTGSPVWTYSPQSGSVRKIAERNMFQTIGYTTDSVTGLSSIEYGAGVFYSAMQADTAAANTFRNGLMPTVGFGMKEVLRKDQRDEFRDNFRREMAGAMNAGKPPLLEGGMTAQPMGINPKDAQLLESRAWSVEEICRWFKVPPFMVGHSEKSTTWGTGIEQQTLGFVKYSLRPWLTRIEQSIRKNLIEPSERKQYFAEFALEGLLRGDTAARTAYYASALQNGYMHRQAVADLENLPPIPGGEVFTVQSNLVPLDQLGKEQPGAVAQDAFKQWLGIDLENLK